MLCAIHLLLGAMEQITSLCEAAGKRNYHIEHIANGVPWEGLEKGDMKGQEGEREGRNYVVIF